jgi:aryl-alcohol dehydrogenase-like predicted oxidoreductase
MFGPSGNPDRSECVRMIHQGLDAGINLIDTADSYSSGVAEEIVGEAIQRRRRDVILTTKVGYPSTSHPELGGNSPGWIKKAIDASLRRLGTDYVDIYLLHRPDPNVELAETLSAMHDIVSLGKARFIGTSTFPAWQIADAHGIAALHGFTPPACEQPPYSLFVRSAERDLFPAAVSFGIGIMVWAPMAGGWLTGKYRAGQKPPSGSRASRLPDFRSENAALAARYDPAHPANIRKFELVSRLEKLASEHGISLMSMALAFAIEHPAVTTAVVGARTPAQLRQLLDESVYELDWDTLDALDAIVPPGSVVNESDLGWSPPWMAPSERRRAPSLATEVKHGLQPSLGESK